MTKHRSTREGPAVEYGHDEARYRATFQQAAIGIVHTAADETILDVNPAFCAILGAERADVVAANIADLLAPGAPAHDDDYAERLMGGEIATHGCIEQYRHASGRTVWVRRSVSLATHADGEPYFIHFVEDITE